MKQTFLPRTALTMVLGWILVSAFALPKSFEGVITYKISYPDSKFTESQLAMFPKIMTIMIKGDKAKSEIQTPMGAQIEITNYADKTKVGLINMMGQKYAIQETADEIQQDMKDDPLGQVQLTDETKTIAGYNCKKAIVTMDDDGSKTTYEVWYNNEFGAINSNFDNALYKDINGVLMEFTMITPQFTMQFSAIAVEKKSVSSKEFEIPAEYTLTTKEELQSKMGGGM
ncbi:MAG: DUF4412 domain-containing protein [bacterium]